MALKADEKAWIQKQMFDAIEKRFEIAAKETLPVPDMLKAFFQKWGGVGMYVSIVLALIAIVTMLGVALLSRATSEATFQGTTETRLTYIEATLRELNAAKNPGTVLKELSTLNQKQFSQNLPALRTVSEQPVSRVPTSPAVLKDVGLRLQRVNDQTTDYWPTVLRFIQFASSKYASDAPALGSQPVSNISDIYGPGIGFPSHMIFELSGVIKDITLEHSRIIFTNKPTTLINVRFVNCAFEFPQTEDPLPVLKEASQQLLLAGVQTATVTTTQVGE